MKISVGLRSCRDRKKRCSSLSYYKYGQKEENFGKFFKKKVFSVAFDIKRWYNITVPV